MHGRGPTSESRGVERTPAHSQLLVAGGSAAKFVLGPRLRHGPSEPAREQDETGQLKARVARGRDTTIKRIELMYRPELLSMAENDRRQLLIALEALTDMESWARMRELHGLSFEEACEVWVHAIDRLLPPTPAN